MQSGSVLSRVAGSHPHPQKLVISATVFRTGLVVDAVTEGQEAQALYAPWRAVEAAECLRKPTERTGREAAEHDACLPCFSQDPVDPVRAPDSEQADHTATADVDQVL